MNKYQEIRIVLIHKARESLWWFCKILEPDFYKDDRMHLKELCDTLQALYEGRIVKCGIDTQWTIINDLNGIIEPYEACNKLMMNVPPQHGKSRTLVNFCKWVFGKNAKERVICWSYNDETASDFSRYTRDGIINKSTEITDINYCDIFPKTKLKKGNTSFEKWALEGSHFSYLGAGLRGSITGKSGSVRIIDDIIKDATDALNEQHLEWIWSQYTGTFLSRQSGHHIDIVNFTRWSEKDLCGRLLKLQPDEWYIFKREAYDASTDSMLCDELLSRDDYESIKSLMMPEIFYANYHQMTLDVQNRLYPTIKEYTELPEFEQITAYTDTADTGDDYLCCIVTGIKDGEAWILDVYYTQDGMEITEDRTADCLFRNSVDVCHIESNNGGRGFARAIERILLSKYKSRRPVIKWFHQSKNKESRIISNSHYVMEHVYFPKDWDKMFPEFYKSVVSYSRKGRNLHDDSVDALSGLVEKIESRKKFQGWQK